MSKRALVFTSTRADYGILRPLLFACEASADIDCSLLVTGTHLSATHGYTLNDVRADGFAIECEAPILSETVGWRGTAETMATAYGQFADAVDESSPDLAIVLGDRFEAFVFASVCHIARVPLVHLHGGEVTEGSIDDSFRHSMSKFADLHLVAAEEFRTRVVQLGEDPTAVHNVGALGLDSIRSAVKGLPLERSSTALVTFHPATLSDEDPGRSMQAIVDACLAYGLDRVVVTAPNVDAGAERITDVLATYAGSERVEVHASLGSERYLRELASCAVVVGNSSSGIIEAPFLGTPTVNVGSRQDGRPREKTVIDVSNPTTERLIEAIGRALALTTPALRPTVYGDGMAAPRCLAAILAFEAPRAGKQFRNL